MDQIKNAIGGHSGNSSGTAGTQQAGGAQKEDYLDKGEFPIRTYPLPFTATDRQTLTPAVRTAFDMGSKKAGHPMDRNTSEKITDGARGLYEKATGKKVNPKISN